jgi:T-box
MMTVEFMHRRCEIKFDAVAKDSRTTSAVATSTGGSMADVTCRLETKELWTKFHQLETEMIITKSGR